MTTCEKQHVRFYNSKYVFGKYECQLMNAIHTGSLSYSASDDEGETVAPGLDDDNLKVLEGKLASGTKRTCEWEREAEDDNQAGTH